ncbi:ABC transporter permease [Actinomadura viridis]|uniref:NitT/TauT family transport system permease protein n=1 Tax=Actinomadura viridis TaxID=58110 RepID=A0A931DT21_9ACTN|nr:ABC transporter permease [Actinomadura viridis]MBG6092970.1 NitT/TauT family transport system permease protein [Actinomadura viridis]
MSRRSGIIALQRLGVLVVLLAAWQLMSGRVVDDFFVSRPTDIASTWWGWLTGGELATATWSTLSAAALGFAAGAVLAVAVGYVLGSSPRLAVVVEPFITAVYSLPKVALVPLFIMWFGIGKPLQVISAAFITFFLMFYNTFFGIRDVDAALVDAIRVMGGTRRDVALRVRLPSALVWVSAGLKISVPQALIGVVVAEMLASDQGLGYLVQHNASQFNAAGTFAALATLLVIGLAVDRLVGLATRRALLWKNIDKGGAP